MSKKVNIILGIIIIAIIAVVGFVFIAPNYKNEIANTSIVDNNNDGKAHSYLQTMRIEKDINVYTKNADAIVVGEFTNFGSAVWNSSKTDISTETFFRVDEVLKGDIKPGEEIKVLQWGGDLDGQVNTYEGAMRYEKGQTNLLFLGTNEDGNWGSFQGDWGQFSVDNNGITKDFKDKSVSLLDLKKQITELVE
jgi:archaellum component FlaF (FlaF/FlaG flagellin family)